METIQETSALIAADKVKGTDVYNANGENLGKISDLMIDKRSGRLCDHGLRRLSRIPFFALVDLDL